jgi:hypothetical protein
MATPLKYPTSLNATQKTLSAQLLAGVTAAVTLNNVVGIQNKAGVFVVDRVDANGTTTASKREYIIFTGVSGSTLTTLTRNADSGGTDQDHAVGAIVEFVSDVLQEQAILDALLLTVTTAGVLNRATGANINTGTDDDKIVTPKAIADSDVVLKDKSQTLTQKTLTSPVINTGISGTGIASGANVTTGTDNTLIVTPKAIGDAGLNTRLKSKLIQVTRDLTAVDGNVSTTGVGFTPTALIVQYGIDSTVYGGNGLADSSKAAKCVWVQTNTAFYPQSTLIFCPSGAGAFQTATVSSYDADGFTLTWAKTGSPTGTLTMNFLCFR